MTTLSFQTHAGSGSRGFAGALVKSVAAVDAALTWGVDRLLEWQQRAYDRHHLRQLDEHMLQDIGLSAADVESEASKPFWRI